MNQSAHPTPLPLLEFVILMAFMSSLGALSIDAILPGLPMIGAELKVANPNDVQLIVSSIMLGMGLGQLFYGPFCDSLGRKPTLCLGVVVFLLGSVACIFADSLETMLLGRLTQGFGVGATRVVSLALIRDSYSGRHMSRVMSFIMMVFVTVPMIAPLLGQTIIELSSWRMIFIAIGTMGLMTMTWFAIRQPETLLPENKMPLTFKATVTGFKAVLSHKVVIAYTLGQGLVFGAFLAYLVSSQAIFEQIYGIVDEFPKYFAIMALAFGCGAVFNSKLVMKFGMRKMIYLSLPLYMSLALLMAVVSTLNNGAPNLLSFILFVTPLFFTLNVMFTNFNSLAMQLMGHMAGVAASVIGSISSFLGVACSFIIGQQFNGTLTFFFVSYLVIGVILIGLTWFAHRACPDLQD